MPVIVFPLYHSACFWIAIRFFRHFWFSLFVGARLHFAVAAFATVAARPFRHAFLRLFSLSHLRLAFALRLLLLLWPTVRAAVSPRFPSCAPARWACCLPFRWIAEGKRNLLFFRVHLRNPNLHSGAWEEGVEQGARILDRELRDMHESILVDA